MLWQKSFHSSKWNVRNVQKRISARGNSSAKQEGLWFIYDMRIKKMNCLFFFSFHQVYPNQTTDFLQVTACKMLRFTLVQTENFLSCGYTCRKTKNSCTLWTLLNLRRPEYLVVFSAHDTLFCLTRTYCPHSETLINFFFPLLVLVSIFWTNVKSIGHKISTGKKKKNILKSRLSLPTNLLLCRDDPLLFSFQLVLAHLKFLSPSVVD